MKRQNECALEVGGRNPDGDTVPININASGEVKVTSSGGGGGAATIADGADVAEGATTDAAIITNATGTISGKLRGLVAIFADVWDSGSHFLKVSIQNATLAVTQSGAWSVAATQATGTNLHVVTDATSTTIATQGTAANLNVTAALVGLAAPVFKAGIDPS